MSLPFTKMHGAGNDFVLLDSRETGEQDWERLAQALCDRHHGVGGDGLLVVLPGERSPIRMRMFNPDGTEDMCGNGLRCVARYAREHGWTASDAFPVETLSGPRKVRIERSPQLQVRARLGVARFRPGQIPALLGGDDCLEKELEIAGRRVRFSSVSTGSTHTVLFVPALPEDAEFLAVSPALETHPAFPERTSVLWATPHGDNAFRVRIWERGVGETLACGTGACAVAAVAQATGRAGSPCRIRSAGGILEVGVGPTYLLTLTGPAEYVCRGAWSGSGPDRNGTQMNADSRG